MLVLGPTGEPADPRGQRVLGHGRRRAAADAAASLPGLQPAEPAARQVAAAERDPRRRGHRAREPRRRRRLEGLRRAGPDRGARVHRRRAARARRADRPRRERQRAAHRPGGRAADHQRRRPARAVRVGVVRDVERCPAAAPRAPPRPARVRGRRAAGMERDAAVLPRDADRGSAGDVRAAQPERSADRARRPVHRPPSGSGAPSPAGRASWSRMPPGCRTGSATTWTGSSGRTSRPSPSGTARCTSGRPAGTCRRSSTGTWATRSSGSS